MKSGAVAKLLGRDAQTILNWTKRAEFEAFLSASARGLANGQREYSDNDVIVLNTIRALTEERIPWDEIKQALERGEYRGQLPTSAAGIEISPVQVYAQNMVAVQQLEDTKRELAQVRKDLDALREIKERERRELDEAHKNEVTQLYRQIGKLEGQLEMLMKQLEQGKD